MGTGGPGFLRPAARFLPGAASAAPGPSAAAYVHACSRHGDALLFGKELIQQLEGPPWASCAGGRSQLSRPSGTPGPATCDRCSGHCGRSASPAPLRSRAAIALCMLVVAVQERIQTREGGPEHVSAQPLGGGPRHSETISPHVTRALGPAMGAAPRTRERQASAAPQHPFAVSGSLQPPSGPDALRNRNLGGRRSGVRGDCPTGPKAERKRRRRQWPSYRPTS